METTKMTTERLVFAALLIASYRGGNVTTIQFEDGSGNCFNYQLDNGPDCWINIKTGEHYIVYLSDGKEKSVTIKSPEQICSITNGNAFVVRPAVHTVRDFEEPETKVVKNGPITMIKHNDKMSNLIDAYYRRKGGENA